MRATAIRVLTIDFFDRRRTRPVRNAPHYGSLGSPPGGWHGWHDPEVPRRSWPNSRWQAHEWWIAR
jgi:hypothetical protein